LLLDQLIVTVAATSDPRTEGVLEEPAPDVLLMDFAPSSTGFIVPPKRAHALDARDRVLTAVENQPTSHGIDHPLSTQQIFSHDQTEDSDGGPSRPPPSG
jgi:small conductance mechanosensitive channel